MKGFNFKENTKKVVNDDSPTCPHCYCDEPDGWELPNESNEMECGCCGEVYKYWSETKRVFTSQKISLK